MIAARMKFRWTRSRRFRFKVRVTAESEVYEKDSVLACWLPGHTHRHAGAQVKAPS